MIRSIDRVTLVACLMGLAALAEACATPPSATPLAAATPANTATTRPTASMTMTPTRTLWPTRGPTRGVASTATITPSPTSIATAALPPQPTYAIPRGLKLEEWELRSAYIPPDPFVPVAAPMESVLERHRVQRELGWPDPVDYSASEGGQLTATAAGTTVVARVDLVLTDAGYKEQLTVSVDDRVVLQHPPETRGVGMLSRLVLHDGHWYLEVVHARPYLGTEIELVSDVIRDGQSLSRALGYDEVFAFNIIDDEPFLLYRLGDRYGLWYGGVEVALDYSGINHNVCCAGGPTNPLSSQDMTAFFAQRGETWYYVELGAFAAHDATPTP